jgi:hypothetical protein
MPRFTAVLLLVCRMVAAQAAPPPPEFPACADGPLFSVIPMDPDDFLAFRPLGFVSVPVHLFPAKHSAFSMALPGEQAQEKPVRFPGDMWVTEVWSTLFPSGASGYQVHYQACDKVRGYFNHLKALAPALKQAFDEMPKSCQDFKDQTGIIVKCQAKVLIQVYAGDPMGVSGDSSAGVDFGLADFRREPAGLVNLEHYPHDYPYYASPVDYFPPGVKEALEAKLGAWDGATPRTAEPKSGNYRLDIAGTAQGNWFFPGVYLSTSTDYSSAIALVGDYIDPAQPVLAAGTSLAGVRMGLYSFKPADGDDAENRVNVPFAKVKPEGGIYCYDGFLEGRTAGKLPLGKIDGVVLVQLTSETTLLVEKQGEAGQSCDALRPWQMSETATRYER